MNGLMDGWMNGYMLDHAKETRLMDKVSGNVG